MLQPQPNHRSNSHAHVPRITPPAKSQNNQPVPNSPDLNLSRVKIVEGNLLTQDADAIVNAWNRNYPLRTRLLVTQGVSKAIKTAAGHEPFRELRKFGKIPLGAARLTSVAFPLIGSGSYGVWGLTERQSLKVIEDEARRCITDGIYSGNVMIVKYKKEKKQ